MDSFWIEIVLVAVAIIANGFFSGSEIALISARIARLAELRQAGTRGAAAALALKESPESFLATIQIAITLVSALASAVGGATAIERLTPAFAVLPLPGAATWAEPVSLGVVVLVITYFSLVVGELVPKAIALRDPERLSCLVAPVIAGLSSAARWLVAGLTASANVLLRLLGQGRAQESPFVSEEEVKYLVREGAAKGIFEKVEEELVHNVFEFADTTVREIMTPRMNIRGLDIDTPSGDILRTAADSGHSYLPVYQGSPEVPLGIVTVQDLLRVVSRGETPVLHSLLRPVLFVPENARVSHLLRQLQQNRDEFALVVDEYGGVIGLVTVEDVVEEIVGDARDDGPGSASAVTRLPDGSRLVDGTTRVEDIERDLGITLPESREYATVAGLLLATLNAIPVRGTSVVIAGLRWTVVDMEGPRIRRVTVRPA